MNLTYFRLMRSLWQHGAAWRVKIVGYHCLFIIAQLIAMLSPYFFGLAFNVLQTVSKHTIYDAVFWLSMCIVCHVLFFVFQVPGRILERTVAFKIKEHFVLTLYQQLTLLPLAWHQDNHSGGIVTKINRAAGGLQRFAENQSVFVQAVLKLGVSIGFLLWISLPVGILAVSLSCLVTVMFLLFDRQLVPLYEMRNRLENRIGAVLFDYINNMTTILTLRLHSLTQSHLAKRMAPVWDPFRREVVLNETKRHLFTMIMISMVTLILIGYVMYTATLTGTFMLGSFIMISRYQMEMNAVFMQAGGYYNDWVRMDTDVGSIHTLIADVECWGKPPHEVMADVPAWQSITVSQLAFSHIDTEREQILADVAFTITRGQKIALIGASGAGKSTLLNVLRGLYTPSSGTLAIDGVVFDSLVPLYGMTTLIPQDPELFEDTIDFNVTCDAPASPAEIESAVQLAGFAEVLAVLPQGLETDIREKGLNLSVGQKQRLALARGLFVAQQSSIVLMDEPTSSVDLVTEKKILIGIFSALPEATCIVSLHRLHLLQNFDAVIMLQEGKVIASGPVAELLHAPGPVRDMWLEYQK
ncbi:MAG: ABC transporter ATP-binding protein [bacterium]